MSAQVQRQLLREKKNVLPKHSNEIQQLVAVKLLRYIGVPQIMRKKSNRNIQQYASS